MQNLSLQYHTALVDYFKKQDKTWKWFADSKVQNQQRSEYQKLLLKNTYRLSDDSESEIYDLVLEAKNALNITKNVTVYQELDTIETNARVSYDGDEVHMVLSGNLIKSLSSKELLSVIGHELSHILFYESQNGDFEVTSRIIHSIANDSRSDDTMVETARLYRLYTELFCDRGAFLVVKDIDTVISALVKVSTGLDKVSASNYLKQAHEICKEDNFGSSGQTHPETFLRAIALEMWSKNNNNEGIEHLIDRRWGINSLDVYKQKKLHEITQNVLHIITKPKWMRTDMVYAHCRQYFPHFSYQDDKFLDEDIKTHISECDDTIREYICYVLLDFALLDSQLETAPVGHAMLIAEELEIQKTLKQLLKKELKLTAKALDAKLLKAAKEVSEMSESEEESILNDE